MPLPSGFKLVGSSTAPAWNTGTPALSAFGNLPNLRPLIMGGGGDWFTVGARDKAKLSTDQLADWNAWLKRIGMPENTFGQFNINPKAGQYAMLTSYDPTRMTYSQYAKNAFSPVQSLNVPASTNAPINATPTVTRTTTPFPQYNTPSPTPATSPTPIRTFGPERFVPERDYNPFPNYNGGRFRTQTQ